MRYYLSVSLGGEKIEREVSREAFIQAERTAGFRPKMASSDPRYSQTLATGGFCCDGVSGRVSYVDE